jgi:ubiquinone/menaquinone biosynthesis C-methylase UbiE
MWHGEFRHPRLVEIYDAQFSWSREDDFFFAFVNQTPSARVADLGCGTGRLTLALAAAGHQVTGVDPARASLDSARIKPDADRVTWIEGTSHALPDESFEVALMTAHVAQFLVNEDDWHSTLEDLHRCLVPGGRLVFDTRDPRARRWEHWNPRESRRRVTLKDGSGVAVCAEVTSVNGDLISFALHYVFDDGEELVSTADLRFRSEHAVREAVHDAGFSIDQIYGGWDGEPVGSTDGELLVHAHRPAARPAHVARK